MFTAEGIGFDSVENAVTLIGRDSEQVLTHRPKEQLARRILEAILAERESHGDASSPAVAADTAQQTQKENA